MQNLVVMLMILLFISMHVLPISTVVIRLIHYQSVRSPYFQMNHSDLEITVARLKQLHSYDGALFDTGVVAKPPIPLFMVEVGIGLVMRRGVFSAPGFPQMLFVDTGSGLLQVKRSTKNTGNVNATDDPVLYPYYDPGKSDSYSQTDCRYCGGKLDCGVTKGGCSYTYKYESSTTLGMLGTEVFSFEPTFSGGRGMTFRNITFGIASRAKFGRINGILGLGTHPFSLLSQIRAREFSICIGNLSDPFSTQYNVLMIGPYGDQRIHFENLESTPFYSSFDSNTYCLVLTGITIGDQTFERFSEPNTCNTKLDLGSVHNILLPDEYDAVYGEIYDWLMKNSFKTHEDVLSPLECFKGNPELLGDLPLLQFEFEGGAILELYAENLFERRTQALVCLNVLPSYSLLLQNYTIISNVIGVTFQQYHYIRYDLENRRTYIVSMDCKSLFKS